MKAAALILLLAAFSQVGLAQTLRVLAQSSGGNLVNVPEGGTLPVSSEGRETLTTFNVTNISGGALMLTGVTLSGTEFTLSNFVSFPFVLNPNATVVLQIRYVPAANGGSSSSQFSIQYTQGVAARVFLITLMASGPDYAFSVVGPDGRRTSVAAGTSISFTGTKIGSSRQFYLAVVNRGSGSGAVTRSVVTGPDFTLGTPNAGTLGPGQELAIPVTFTARTKGVSTGLLSVTLSGVNGALTFPLDGLATAPEFVPAYALRSDGNVRALSNNGVLTFASTAAATTTVADIVVGNRGDASGELRNVVLTGSAFQLTGLPLLPATIEPTQLARFSVTFNPRQLGSYSGQLRLELENQTIVITLEGATLSPAMAFSYVDPSTNSVLPVPSGSTLRFADTTVGNTLTYSVVVRNRGEGTGFIDAISIAGDSFQLVALPALPFSIAAGAEMTFGVRYRPTTRGASSGSLRIEYSGGSASMSLSGTGTKGDFSYEVSDPRGEPVSITSGSQLSFSAPTGQTTMKLVRVTNSGDASLQLTRISITGSSFQVTSGPAVPVTIGVGNSVVYTVTFAPIDPGSAAGRLQIEDASFPLNGIGLGESLEYSYSNAAGATKLPSGDTIVFSPTRVGEQDHLDLVIRNTGTTVYIVTLLDASPTQVYTIVNSAPLPFSLEPGQSARVGVRFQPNNTGVIAGAMRVNGTTFQISGAGRDPVPLPETRIDIPPGVQAPLQQPSARLSMAAPYPLAISGVLRLTFSSDVFAENPAVQFATGGRTIGFTIKAGDTQAIFDNGQPDIRFQTGSVAGTLQLRPSFATQAGLNLTPADPPVVPLTINRSVPQILSATIATRTTNSLTIQVTGYTTTRSLRQADINLTPRPGAPLSATNIQVSLSSLAIGWFDSALSQAYGGLFSISIPITFQRPDSTDDLTRFVEALTMTMSNDVGTSAAINIRP